MDVLVGVPFDIVQEINRSKEGNRHMSFCVFHHAHPKIVSTKCLGVYIAMLLSILLLALQGTTLSVAAATPPTSLKQAMFVVNGVTISATSRAFPNTIFHTNDLGNSTQIAMSIQHYPYTAFSVIAAPLQSHEENVQPVASAPSQAYGALVYTALQHQTQAPQEAPSIYLFRASVPGKVYHVNMAFGAQTPQPALIVEWTLTVEANLWHVRFIVAETADISLSTSRVLAQLQGTELVGLTESSHPSTGAIPSSAPQTYTTTMIPLISNPNWVNHLNWWYGDCDVHRFPGSYRLGGSWGISYLGVYPCGPGKTFHVVSFFPQAFGEAEWQCVELSMRFMYLVYGIHPYPANGKDVVPNYAGTRLQKFLAQNNYIGPDHPIGPGDILSFGPVTTKMHFAYKNPYGHTSVVTAVDLDENGNGTITTMEENGSANGIARYVVDNWTINTNADGVGPFIGWLHNPKDNPPTPTPTPTPSD
jgi:hypothetical protein